MTDTIVPARPARAEGTVLAIILAVSLCHMINDIMQSLLAAIYPMLKTDLRSRLLADRPAHLGLPGDGVAAAAADRHVHRQAAAALFAAGRHGARRWSASSCSPSRTTYALLVVGAVLIGFGSAIFHPESSRVARLASGGRFGLAQSLFQLGGNFGQAIGPLLAAFIVVPYGQGSVAWFTLARAGRHHRAVAGRRLVQRASARPRPAQVARLAVSGSAAGAGW